MTMLKVVCCMAFCLSVAACQSTSDKRLVQAEPTTLPEWQSAEFAALPIETPEMLFNLTAEQKAAFLAYYNDPNNADTSSNFRLYQYLDQLVKNFSYVGDTFTAEEALNKQSGNCLSLAILTTALARLVNLDVYYQTVHTEPLYRRLNDILTTSSHVRSIVLGPKPQKEDGVIIFRSRAVIDYFPSSSNDVGEYVSDVAFISMYYQNKAAIALGEGNNALAYSYLAQAMMIDPTNAQTINTLAVLYRRHGYLDKARALYEFVINNDIESVHTLSNFALLLKKVGDIATLEKIGEMYLRADDSNPYRWYDLGNEYLAREDYKRAETFFKRTVKHGPYLSEGYFGLAKVNFLQGDSEGAEHYLSKALSLTYDNGDHALYTAKLNAIQHAN